MRTIPRRLLVLSLAAIAAAPVLRAQAGDEKTEPLQVAVVGASLSKGLVLKTFISLMGKDPRAFAEQRAGRPVSDLEFEVRTESSGLKEPLRKLLADRAVVRDYSDLYFFQDPIETGRTELQRAMRHSDFLIGLDLPFWFGYGPVRAAGADEIAQARYDLQAKGLALIEEEVLDKGGRIVVGDYPDVHGADPMMLSPRWIPDADVLAELNRRLCAWAEEHEGASVYPLSKRMQEAREGHFMVAIGDGERRLDITNVLQLDGLHPTKFGVAAIVADAANWIRGHDAKFALAMPETNFEEAAEALRLVDPVVVLDALQEKGKDAAVTPAEAGIDAERPARKEPADKEPAGKH